MFFLDQSSFPMNAKWKQNAYTIAGGNQQGNGLNQLSEPYGIYVDDDEQAIYIADALNDRVVKWKFHATSGEIVAIENATDEFNGPSAVTVDKKNDSLIICEHEKRRVVRWSRRDGTMREIIMSNISCFDVTMDDNGDLYVSTWSDNEVRRWREGNDNGIIVAGGNGPGSDLGQLDYAGCIFVDNAHSIYVSDIINQRVMKWMKDAQFGSVVAGVGLSQHSHGNLNTPVGVIVDHFDSVYVADTANHRIMRWMKGSTEGQVIVGGNGLGAESNQLNEPYSISFDRKGNLYVVDRLNHRVQKFDIILT
jgi:sugar lactone lactonase YvrE